MAQRAAAPLAPAVGALLGVGLLIGALLSGWAGWIVAAAAIAVLALLAAVPLALVGLAAALIHPDSRGWLVDQAVQHLKHRHAVRLAAARSVPQQQHIHVLPGEARPGDVAYPVEVLPYRELPERAGR